MTDASDIVPYLVFWVFAMGAIVWQTWRRPGAGLMLAYCFQMFILYWVGAAAHVLPWGDLPDTDSVYLGFQQCTFALVAFGVGSTLIGPRIADYYAGKQKQQIVPDPNLPRAYILYGICSYFVLVPTLGAVRGFGAVSAVGSQLVVVGCCLNCWKAWQMGGRPALLRALGPTLLIPCVTAVFQGFLGFGVMALSTITVFCAQFFRPRWILLLGLVCSTYVGLSVYVAYMKGRAELRTTVWDPEKSIVDKVDQFLATFQGFEWFDPTKEDHLEAIDGRLNQDALVGKAVTYLDATDGYARGETLLDAVVAMVPRVIWPDKPIEAGSGGLATRFTGEIFAASTSVGVGPVLELYGNFGTITVVLGFLFLGVLIKTMDSLAGAYLNSGNWHSFATCCLVGISFLNVGGSFVETSMAAAASLVLAKFVNSLLKRRKAKGKSAAVKQSPTLAEV